MCGIAGIIYKNGNGGHRIGRDITRMLQAMKHRGPDSTGFALYRAPTQELVMRIKLADANQPRDLEFADGLRRHRARDRGAGCAAPAPQIIGDRGQQRVHAQRSRSPTTATSSGSPTTSSR